MNNIGAVVSFSANEYRFLAPCLNELRAFCDQIVVACGDSLYDGTPENQTLLDRARMEHRDVKFVYFTYSDQFRALGTMFWGGFQRVVGIQAFDPPIESILIMDVDEIIESQLFIKTLGESNYRDYNLLSFVAYWYFGSASNQATQLEQGPVLVKRSRIHPGWMVTPADRNMLLGIIPDPKLDRVTYGDAPMVHHYSWVRTREEMLQKVRSWGHNRDRDWVKLVEDYFALPEQARTGENFRDFVHGYSYRKVKPYITFDESQPAIAQQK